MPAKQPMDYSKSDCNRRTFLGTAVAGTVASTLLGPRHVIGAPPARSTFAADQLGIPGPYRGQVIEVGHRGSVAGDQVNAKAVRAMMQRGMRELTGAEGWTAAWRTFFEPGDVVGIKVNPVGMPLSISNHAVVHQIVDGLKEAGVKPTDIVVFDRYRKMFIEAGYVKNLPDGVRWDAAVEQYDSVQLDIKGYDPDVFVEMELAALGRHDPKDSRIRRSHLCLIVSERINKLINVPVLKDHGSAGVTLALKNMSHGLVNNVSRSHSNHYTNACNTFIPEVVSGIPQIRQKTVLHILDGLKAVFQGGPYGREAKWVWPYRSLFFATDPVAMDHIAWEIIDAKRVSKELPPVARSGRDLNNGSEGPGHKEGFDVRQPQHIPLAAAVGLGVFDKKKIEHRKLRLA